MLKRVHLRSRRVVLAFNLPAFVCVEDLHRGLHPGVDAVAEGEAHPGGPAGVGEGRRRYGWHPRNRSAPESAVRRDRRGWAGRPKAASSAPTPGR